jgi:hypothetical protein
VGLLGAVPEQKWILRLMEFDDMIKTGNRGCGDVEQLKHIKTLQIFTAESSFPDKTKLTFGIDGPYLFKFNRAFIQDVVCPPFILLSESTVLPVRIGALGLNGKSMLISEIHTSKGILISKKTTDIAEKISEVYIPIAGLDSGDYELRIHLKGNSNSITKRFNIVADNQ